MTEQVQAHLDSHSQSGVHLHLDCAAGISGDMFLGALLDLGWSENRLREGLSLLGLDKEFHFHVRRVHRCSIAATKFDLHPSETHSGHAAHGSHGGSTHSHEHGNEYRGGHSHGEHRHSHSHQHGGAGHDHGPHSHHSHGRPFSEIRDIIRASALPGSVRESAVAVFYRIAVAEGKIHGQPAESVTFHEVGAIDSIVDIVGVCLGLHELGIASISSSVPVEGSGHIECAHGCYPLPAPATAEILRGIPWRQIEAPGERITPTGAAFLAEFVDAFGELPPLKIHTIGYGAGTRNPDQYANVLRVMKGECLSPETSLPYQELAPAIIEIATNLDDCTPEILAAATEVLLQAGALDVFTVPCTMKKGRSGHLLTVLAEPADREKITTLILRHTPSFGVRWHKCERHILSREMRMIPTLYGSVQVKVGLQDGQVWQWSPEYEDCRTVAQAANVPVARVFEEAVRQRPQS